MKTSVVLACFSPAFGFLAGSCFGTSNTSAALITAYTLIMIGFAIKDIRDLARKLQ